MNTQTHIVVFVKDAQRRLNEKTIWNNTEHILGVNTKSLTARGWTVAHSPLEGMSDHWSSTEILNPEPGGNTYQYQMFFKVTYTGDTEPTKTELRSIVRSMNVRSTNPLGGRWKVSLVDGETYEATKDGDVVSVKDFVAYAEPSVPENFESAFDHLYGLDSHIGRIKGAIDIAVTSQFMNRYHVALIGPPGCGKSDICETLSDILGDAVMKFDATATTAAGAIKQLDEAEILPRILVVEEIEKVNPDALSFLLALMDMRGEIRKTTARSKIVKDTKILVVATVNNDNLFDNMLAGALSSRFANKLWFHRPDESTIRRILVREIAKLDGDEAWIDPVVEYAREKNINDPRTITALCLCGRDGWLDGSYVKMLADTDKPQDY